jgi:hypothetical protein
VQVDVQIYRDVVLGAGRCADRDVVLGAGRCAD